MPSTDRHTAASHLQRHVQISSTDTQPSSSADMPGFEPAAVMMAVTQHIASWMRQYTKSHDVPTNVHSAVLSLPALAVSAADRYHASQARAHTLAEDGTAARALLRDLADVVATQRDALTVTVRERDAARAAASHAQQQAQQAQTEIARLRAQLQEQRQQQARAQARPQASSAQPVRAAGPAPGATQACATCQQVQAAAERVEAAAAQQRSRYTELQAQLAHAQAAQARQAAVIQGLNKALAVYTAGPSAPSAARPALPPSPASTSSTARTPPRNVHADSASSPSDRRPATPATPELPRAQQANSPASLQQDFHSRLLAAAASALAESSVSSPGSSSDTSPGSAAAGTPQLLSSSSTPTSGRPPRAPVPASARGHGLPPSVRHERHLSTEELQAEWDAWLAELDEDGASSGSGSDGSSHASE